MNSLNKGDALFTQAMGLMVESAMQGKQGIEDCKKGLSPQSDNEHYLEGYGHQYEIEAKEGAENG